MADPTDLRETFADSINNVIWEGQTLRIEFAVTRFSVPTPAGKTEATRHAACRLVLTAAAAADLANRLQRTIAALKDATAAQAKAPEAVPPAADRPQ